MLTYKNRIADGVSMVQWMGGVDTGDTLREGKTAALLAENGVREAQWIFCVTGVPSGVVFVRLTGLEEKEYQVGGTVTPVGETVYISKADGERVTPEMLEENLVISAQADGEGEFVTEAFPGWAGDAVVWIKTEPNLLGGSSAALSCALIDPNDDDYVGVEEGVCLAGDTRIAMADGGFRRLDELARGDRVLGGDGLPAAVIRQARGVWNERHILYHFDDGTTIDEIHEHRFFNVEQGFWQKLKNWRAGEHARRRDGGLAALAGVEPVEEPAEMFGLWVERGSYWANGLLSGDAGANIPLLTHASPEQAADMALSLKEMDVLKVMGLEDLLP